MLKFYTNSLILLLLLLAGESYAQLDPERKAWSRLQDGKYERAQRLLQKSLHKDPSNLEAIYVLANWFFVPANPKFQIDSAYYYINKSISGFDTLSLREKDKLIKFPVDSLILRQLKGAIDSAAFVRAKQVNTEESYLQFIKSFSTALQVGNAIELRDEVSFLEALKINTYQSFQAYLFRYPQSHRAQEATDRYDKLLFEGKTKSKKLESFKSFLKDYPQSPYADQAQQQIFEIATASGEPKDFFSYLKEYPSARQRKMVDNILFHIYKDREETIPASILTDSLKRVMEVDARFWIPFLKNGAFGFMDQTGTELLSPQFQDVRDEYKCGPVMDDILSLTDGYFSRTGKKIANNTSSVKSIGYGYLMVNDQNCKTLIHKSGSVVISDCYEDYYMVDDNFIAAIHDGYYTLFTLAGRLLPVKGVSQVEHAEGLILLTRSGKKVINTVEQLASLADGSPFQDQLVFDEVKAFSKGLLLVRNSGLEGILNTNLDYVVPLDRHSLTKTSFGFIKNQNGRISVFGLSAELENKTYDNIAFHGNWLALSGAQKSELYDMLLKQRVVSDADSVWFDQRLAFTKKNNKYKVYLSASHFMDLQADSKINFVSSKDSVQFFYTESKRKNTVFTLEKGEQLLATEFVPEESLGNEFFIVSKGSKKGLLGRNGKTLVPVEMDEIILKDNSYLAILKDKKFGLYDLLSRRYIKPIYERNLIPIGKQNLVVYKNGAYGLIDQRSKPETEFEFSEVLAWSDSLIWVKKDFQWKLLNYHTQKVFLDRVKNITWLKNGSNEKIVRIYRDNYYGIVSNRRGVVVVPSFTEIIDLGTADHPFYFTEKNVEEAGIFIVVYFDEAGKLVRKHAYEEDEYDRILCEDH